MRLYTFCNVYLSSIQQGIQTAHVVSELAVKSSRNDDFSNWCRNHKTIIVLNGGNSRSLGDIRHMFGVLGEQYQWTSFHEDSDSLNGALTAVGILLPASIYNHPSRQSGYNQSDEPATLSSTDALMIKLLNEHRLAS